MLKFFKTTAMGNTLNFPKNITMAIIRFNEVENIRRSLGVTDDEWHELCHEAGTVMHPSHTYIKTALSDPMRPWNLR